MKSLVLLAIFAIFAPVAAYGQTAMGSITIEPYLDSTDIAVAIEGELDSGGLAHLVIRGNFGPNSPSAHMMQHTFATSYSTHVFNLDMPFQLGEKYTVSVYNGENVRAILWVPLSVSQQTANSNSNTVEEIAFDLTEDESADMIQTLLDENIMLKPQIENKDRIIFEQLKVIQALAPKTSNAIFEESSSNNLHLIAGTAVNTDYIQSLAEENKLLKIEIENQQAIIMEQVNVIQNLASEWTNTSFESSLNHYSPV